MGRRDPIHFKKYMSSHADKRAPHGHVPGSRRYGANRPVLDRTCSTAPKACNSVDCGVCTPIWGVTITFGWTAKEGVGIWLGAWPTSKAAPAKLPEFKTPLKPLNQRNFSTIYLWNNCPISGQKKRLCSSDFQSHQRQRLSTFKKTTSANTSWKLTLWVCLPAMVM